MAAVATAMPCLCSNPQLSCEAMQQAPTRVRQAYSGNELYG